MSTRRVRNEIQLWAIHWQQLDTLYDRVQGAKDEDRPYAVRCKALYDAAVVLERLRLRRTGEWMPHPWPMGPGVGATGAIETDIGDRHYELPGALDVEMAVAGLTVDDDGEAETDTPKALFLGSEDLFDVWDPESRLFVPQFAPDYLFGRLDLGQGVEYPWIPGLFEPQTIAPQIGEDADSDDSLFSVPRRRAAAAEGVVRLKLWSELRRERRDRIEADDQAEHLAAGTPDFASLRDLIVSGSYPQARTLLDQAVAWANTDIASLQSGIDLLEADDPDDDAIQPLKDLNLLVAQERDALLSARDRLTGSVSGADKNLALALVNQLPATAAADAQGETLYPLLDAAVEARIAYPDGPLRGVRALELGLLKIWRSKAPWFDLRQRLVLSPLMARYFKGFEDNLASLVEDGRSYLTPALDGLALETATAANSDKLPLKGGPHDLRRVRPGQIAVLGGARPALAVILGHKTTAANRQQLRILPLRVSLAQGLGLDGIPGLVQGDVTLGKALSRPSTGDELRRGRRAGEPEGDAIPQEIVALWSRLRLMRGSDFPLSLRAPFSAALNLPVHATAEQPLEARAARLLLPTGPYDDTTDPPHPLFATPGEILLLRGRDAGGLWWQGAVESSGASVTTMEAQDALPERDPQSPICCEPETPVVLVTLSMNSMPVPLVEHVTLHRDFRGFGWPGLAVGALLPSRIDPATTMLTARAVGNGYTFDTGPDGDLVDRTPELHTAAQILGRWLGEP